MHTQEPHSPAGTAGTADGGPRRTTRDDGDGDAPSANMPAAEQQAPPWQWQKVPAGPGPALGSPDALPAAQSKAALPMHGLASLDTSRAPHHQHHQYYRSAYYPHAHHIDPLSPGAIAGNLYPGGLTPPSLSRTMAIMTSSASSSAQPLSASTPKSPPLAWHAGEHAAYNGSGNGYAGEVGYAHSAFTDPRLHPHQYSCPSSAAHHATPPLASPPGASLFPDAAFYSYASSSSMTPVPALESPLAPYIPAPPHLHFLRHAQQQQHGAVPVASDSPVLSGLDPQLGAFQHGFASGQTYTGAAATAAYFPSTGSPAAAAVRQYHHHPPPDPLRHGTSFAAAVPPPFSPFSPPLGYMQTSWAAAGAHTGQRHGYHHANEGGGGGNGGRGAYSANTRGNFHRVGRGSHRRNGTGFPSPSADFALSSGGDGGGLMSYIDHAARLPTYPYSPPLPGAAYFEPLLHCLPSHTEIRSHALGAPRSALLEEFRATPWQQWAVADLQGHLAEFSTDQQGSRFIQERLASSDATAADERQLIFRELIGGIRAMMEDVFGNYVVQKLIEFGTLEQRTAVIDALQDNIAELSQHMYGCRVVQKALEYIDEERTVAFASELKESVGKCLKDQSANHVLQKLLESIGPCAGIDFIAREFRGNVPRLAVNCYSCRVLQRVLENCTEEQTRPLLEEVHENLTDLMQDQFGNYVISWMLQSARKRDSERVIESIKGHFVALSKHKFASNVLEVVVAVARAITPSLPPDAAKGAYFQDFLAEVLEGAPAAADPNGNDTTTTVGAVQMMNHSYANYVLQGMIKLAGNEDKKKIADAIRPELARLRRQPSGHAKHLIAIEKIMDGLGA